MKARMYEASYNNVRIRPLEKKDIEQLRLWRNNPENTKYLRNIGIVTPEMQNAWFDGYLKRDEDVIFAIEETKELNRLVGSLSLYDFENGVAEIGKILIGDPEAHGKGIGRISFVLAMMIGFKELGLNKIVASVSPENIPAYTNYMKIGFEICGQHDFMDGIEYEIVLDYKKMREKNTYIEEVTIIQR